MYVLVLFNRTTHFLLFPDLGSQTRLHPSVAIGLAETNELVQGMPVRGESQRVRVSTRTEGTGHYLRLYK